MAETGRLIMQLENFCTENVSITAVIELKLQHIYFSVSVPFLRGVVTLPLLLWTFKLGQVKRSSDRTSLASLSLKVLQIHCKAYSLLLEGSATVQGYTKCSYTKNRQNVVVSGGTCVSITILQ